jgi:hypothetical protein
VNSLSSSRRISTLTPSRYPSVDGVYSRTVREESSKDSSVEEGLTGLWGGFWEEFLTFGPIFIRHFTFCEGSKRIDPTVTNTVGELLLLAPENGLRKIGCKRGGKEWLEARKRKEEDE